MIVIFRLCQRLLIVLRSAGRTCSFIRIPMIGITQSFLLKMLGAMESGSSISHTPFHFLLMRRTRCISMICRYIGMHGESMCAHRVRSASTECTASQGMRMYRFPVRLWRTIYPSKRNSSSRMHASKRHFCGESTTVSGINLRQLLGNMGKESFSILRNIHRLGSSYDRIHSFMVQ